MKFVILFLLSLSLLACSKVPETAIDDLKGKWICVAGTETSYFVERIDTMGIWLLRIPEGDIFCRT